MLTAMEPRVETARLERLEQDLAALRGEVERLRAELPRNSASFCLLSGDYERVMAALMMANMAAALEMETTIFCAFWGVQAIRRTRAYDGKSVMEKAMSAMLAQDVDGLASAKFNFGGLGPRMFEQIMRQKGIATPGELLRQAGEARVRLVACTTSMEVFGIDRAELLPAVELCGAAEFLEEASRGRLTMCL